MEQIELISYLILMAITVFFTAFTLSKKSLIFAMFAAIFWGISAQIHMALTYNLPSLSIFYMGYLYWGLSILFIGLFLMFSLDWLRKSNREREVTV
jgi:hypothetical protein